MVAGKLALLVVIKAVTTVLGNTPVPVRPMPTMIVPVTWAAVSVVVLISPIKLALALSICPHPTPTPGFNEVDVSVVPIQCTPFSETQLKLFPTDTHLF